MSQSPILNGQIENLPGTYYRNGIVYRSMRMSALYLNAPALAFQPENSDFEIPEVKFKEYGHTFDIDGSRIHTKTLYLRRGDNIYSKELKAMYLDHWGISCRNGFSTYEKGKLFEALSPLKGIPEIIKEKAVKTCYLVAKKELTPFEISIIDGCSDSFRFDFFKEIANSLHLQIQTMKVTLDEKYLLPFIKDSKMKKAIKGIF